MNMMISAAATSALATPALAATNFDPIFAAIEAHRRASDAYRKTLENETALENSIPARKRRSHYIGREEKTFSTDDPRWVFNSRRGFELSRAVDDLSWGLVEIQPTTLAGIAALISYAAEHQENGDGWPDRETEGGDVRPWIDDLLVSLATAARALGIAQTGTV